VAWAADAAYADEWRRCERGDWLAWLLVRLAARRGDAVLVAALLADLAAMDAADVGLAAASAHLVKSAADPVAAAVAADVTAAAVARLAERVGHAAVCGIVRGHFPDPPAAPARRRRPACRSI
jgi:predicted alpha/beta hydrolase family esterase